MGFGPTNHLLALCGGVFLASAWIASRRLPCFVAVAIAMVRVLLPLVYFAWYFDGHWTLIDDLMYLDHGELLLEQEFTPLVILTGEGRNTLHSICGGWHILFSWWNLVVMWLFGTYYYVPVLVNVVITFCSGHLLAHLLEELGFPESYRRGLHVFYLLHWDTIAWSSIVNVKDPIVQWMTIAFFLSAVRLVRRRSWLHLAICLALITCFQYIRFYIPFILGIATGICLFLEWRDFRKYPLLGGGLLIGLWLLPGYAMQLWENYSYFGVLYGVIRFALTPQPWEIASGYTYLFLPATFHWLMAAPAMVGGVMLWRDSKLARILLIYAAVMTLMYAITDELQGVRQRSQLSFIIAWMQMHLVWRWVHTPANASSSSRALRRHNLHAHVTGRPARLLGEHT